MPRHHLHRLWGCLFVTSLAIKSPTSLAQEKSAAQDAPAAAVQPRTVLHFTIFDAPYNLRHGYKSPSMSESLDITRSWYSTIHYGLDRLLPAAHTRLERALRFGAFLAADYSLVTFPLSTAWMHEEWHRAVMTHRNIPSHNTINDLKLFKDVYYVSGQSDEDLARLKRAHPKDQLRLSSAGDESEREFILAQQKDNFFRNLDTSSSRPLMWLTQMGSIGYVFAVAQGDFDKEIPKLEKEEGTDIRKRDFIGPDHSGWVRDMFRPNEAFEARGTHPTGIGIRRYTALADLTDAEKSFLKKQANLHLLNLLDPSLYGFDSFSMTSPTTGRELAWNFALSHYFTPFGHALRFNTFMKTVEKETPFGTQGLYFAWQQNVSKNKNLPQVEIEHRPLPLGETTLGLGARMSLWLQPKDLDYFATSSTFGGLLSAKLIRNSPRGYQPWLEVSGKTEGWVAGEVDLGQTYGLRAGFDFELGEKPAQK